MKRTVWTLLALAIVAALIFGGTHAFRPDADKQERVAIMAVKQQMAFAPPPPPIHGEHRVQVMIREVGPRGGHEFGYGRGDGGFGTFFKVLIVGALGYALFRFLRRKKRRNAALEFDAALPMPLDKPFPSRHADLLDQWEEKTRRELNHANTTDTTNNKEEK